MEASGPRPFAKASKAFGINADDYDVAVDRTLQKPHAGVGNTEFEFSPEFRLSNKPRGDECCDCN